MTWKRYDDMEADQILVRSLIVRSLNDLKAARSVISEPTDEWSRDNRQIACPGEITRS